MITGGVAPPLYSGGVELGGGVRIGSGASLNLQNPTVTGYWARLGGGIHNDGALTVIASTISDNTGTTLGGGLLNDGTVTVTGSTFSGNNGGIGGGFFYFLGSTSITNSLALGNTASSSGGETSGGSTDAGGNLIGGANVNDVFANVAGGAGVLADNGGPVQTVALFNSVLNPAFDAGIDSDTPTYLIDGGADGSPFSIDPVTAFMSGKLKVEGNPQRALKVSSILTG